MTEKDLQGAVIDCARLFGWRVAHFRPAQTKHGWRTPVAADGAGFPDLVLVRDRVVYVELKAEKGKPSAAQLEWVQALTGAGCEVYVWRPDDWLSGRIDRVLMTPNYASTLPTGSSELVAKPLEKTRRQNLFCGKIQARLGTRGLEERYALG